MDDSYTIIGKGAFLWIIMKGKEEDRVPGPFSRTFRLTPLLHKDVVESNVCSHKKAVSNLLGILSKGNSWIDPGDGH